MKLSNTVFQTSMSAMLNQRKQIQIASENLANSQTTRTSSGTPYKPRELVFSPADPSGTDLSPRVDVVEVPRFRHEFNPDHPDSDENGMVAYPDIDTAEEMHRMITAMRLYEASMNAIESEKEIIKRSFDMSR